MQRIEFTPWLKTKALHLLNQSITSLNSLINEQTQIYKKEQVEYATETIPIDYLQFQLNRLLDSFKSNLLFEFHQASFNRKFICHHKIPIDKPIKLDNPLPSTLLEKAKIMAIAPLVQNLPQLAFLDIETDGLDISSSNILQVAIIKPIIHSQHDSLHHIMSWSRYFIPYEGYTEQDNKALHINHIGNDQLYGAFTMEEAASYIAHLLKDTIIIGYNINNFDIPILQRHLKAENCNLMHKFSIDLYPACWKNKKQKLQDALATYNIQPNENPHCALADAKCCIDLLSELIDKNELPNTEEDLLNLYNQPNNIWQHFKTLKIIEINSENSSYSHLLYSTPPSTQTIKRQLSESFLAQQKSMYKKLKTNE